MRRESLEVGDLVLVFDVLRQKDMTKARKQQPRWYGPFRIAEKSITSVTYKLEELDGAQLQSSFHGNRLKKFVKDDKGWWTPADGEDTVKEKFREHTLRNWEEALRGKQGKKVRFEDEGEAEEEANPTEGNPVETLMEGDDGATPGQTFYEMVPRDFKPKMGIEVVLPR